MKKWGHDVLSGIEHKAPKARRKKNQLNRD